MSSVAVVARWSGYCQPCDTDRPLVLTSHGQHGARAWLAGHGPEDRELAYSCEVCGRSEHVPATLALDEAYDATLPRWPDLQLPDLPVELVTTVQLQAPASQDLTSSAVEPVVVAAPLPPVRVDVWQLAVQRLTVTVEQPVRTVGVQTHAVPLQRVDVTDLLDLLALSA